MGDIAKTVAAERFKLSRQKITWILPIAVVLVVFIMSMVLEFAARQDWIGVPSGYFVAASVINWMSNVLLLLVVVVTSFLIAQEFAIGTVKGAWIRPLERSKWFTGKIVVTLGVVTILFVLAVTIAMLIAFVRIGFSDLMENTYLIHSSGALFGRLLLCTALTIWALWSAAMLVAMIAGGMSHPGGTIAVALAVGIGMTIMGAIDPVRPYLISSYVALPFEQMVAMSKGLPLPLEWGQLVMRSLGVPAVWMLATFLIGQRVIRKREISG